MHVFINSAMSADGKISNVRRQQVRISEPDDFERVDRLRADTDAIGVGVGTVLADDPSLTVKGEGESPLRVVFDSEARTSLDSEVLKGDVETIVFVGERAEDGDVEGLRQRVDVVRTRSATVDLSEAVEKLEERGVESLMVEGGGSINYSFLREKLIDEVLVYVGSSVIGGADAPTLVDGDGFLDEYPRLELGSLERMGNGVLLRWEVDEKSY